MALKAINSDKYLILHDNSRNLLDFFHRDGIEIAIENLKFALIVNKKSTRVVSPLSKRPKRKLAIYIGIFTLFAVLFALDIGRNLLELNEIESQYAIFLENESQGSAPGIPAAQEAAIRNFWGNKDFFLLVSMIYGHFRKDEIEQIEFNGKSARVILSPATQEKFLEFEKVCESEGFQLSDRSLRTTAGEGGPGNKIVAEFRIKI